MVSKDFPMVSEALLVALEAVFPNKLPTTSIDIEELRKLQGQQSVIDHLRAQHKKQSNK